MRRQPPNCGLPFVRSSTRVSASSPSSEWPVARRIFTNAHFPVCDTSVLRRKALSRSSASRVCSQSIWFRPTRCLKSLYGVAWSEFSADEKLQFMKLCANEVRGFPARRKRASCESLLRSPSVSSIVFRIPRSHAESASTFLSIAVRFFLTWSCTFCCWSGMGRRRIPRSGEREYTESQECTLADIACQQSASSLVSMSAS